MDKKLKEHFLIDKTLPVPLYYQLKTQLLKLIDEGYFKSGDKLPTESELCALLDISRPTIRQAFSELIKEGYIIRKKAKGTFVSQPKVEGYFFQKLSSYNEEMESLGLHPSTKVIGCEVIKAPDVCRQLQTDKVIYLQRVRYADDKEMVYVETYLPFERLSNIQKYDFTKFSLYNIMEKDYNCSIAYVDRIVEAAHADKKVKEYLNMNEDDVILHVCTTAYTKENEAVEVSIASYHGQRNSFTMKLTNTKI